MTRRGGKRGDLLWGLLAQFLQYGSVLLVLPLIVTRLPSAEVGLWFVFVTIQALVAILDFGFAPTFSRNFAFVFAGAQELRSQGVPEGSGSTNPALLAELLRASRTLYAGIGGLVAVVLAGPGSWYVHTLLASNPDLRGAWLAWGAFALAAVVNVYYSWYTPLLNGAGRVREGYQVAILNRGAFALLGCGVLLAGGGLVALSASYLAGAVLSRVYAGRMCRPLLAIADGIRPSAAAAREMVRKLWHNSYRSGVVALGAFLITRFAVFVVSSSYGLAVGASYSITLQVFSVITSVSQVALVTFLPRFAAARVSADTAELRRLFVASTLVMLGAFLLLGGATILFGNLALSLINSRTLLLDRPVLALLALIWLLEANHSLCATVITTANVVPFMRAAVGSGLAICALSVAIAWLGGGLAAVIAAQGTVQLLYNNWKWPQMVYREFGLRLTDLTAPFLKRTPVAGA